MKHFYIDTKTVKDFDFLKVYSVTEYDEVVLFFQGKSLNLGVDGFKLLIMSGFNFDLEDVKGSEESSLYFNIIARLSISKLNSNDRYYIVTNSKEVKENIKIAVDYLVKNTETSIEVISSNEYIDAIKHIIKNSEMYIDLRNNFRKKFGDKAGNELYWMYKDSFEENIKEVN